jgi:uncharacterized membrane protein
MDFIVVLFGIAVLFLLIAPIFGLIAFFQLLSTKRDLLEVRREIYRLRQIMGGAPAAETPSTPIAPQPIASSVPPTRPSQSAPQPAPPPSPQPAMPTRAAAPQAQTQTPFAATSPTASKSIDWERMIASNWMVWTGGLALAVGGLFLVRVVIDAGLFGPVARIISAVILGAGLIAAALRSESWALVKSADTSVRHLPSILAGAGVISLYGAAIGAGFLYDLVPPLVALGLLIAASVVAVLLSLRFGPLLAALGLTGAYVAPLLTGAIDGSAVPLLPYAALVTAAGLTLMRLKGWRAGMWIILPGAAFWGWVALAGADPAREWAIPAYALGLAAMGLLFGERDADAKVDWPQQWLDIKNLPGAATSSILAAHLFFLLAGGLIWLSGIDKSHAPVVVTSALALLGGFALLASWQRAGYALITPLAGGITLVCLLVWSAMVPNLAYACVAAALGFGLGGTAVMSRLQVKAPVATAAALVPPAALFIAFWRHNALSPGFEWGFAALLMACGFGAVLDWMRRRDPQFKNHPGGASLYAIGIVLSAGLAPFLVLSGLWLGPAMAVVAVAIALVCRRFNLPILVWAGPVAVAAATGLLIRPGMLSGMMIAPTPILNEMTAGFAIAIAALLGGAWLSKARPRMRRAYEAGALILGFSLVGLTIRHIAGGGVLNGPFAGLGEASSYAIAYLGMAISFAWRLRGPSVVWRVFEGIAVVLGLLGIFIAFTELPNTSLGYMPIANLLFPAFAMPAILLGVYSFILRRTGRTVHSQITGIAAMGLGFVWVTLETARAIGGPFMDIDDDRLWAFSIAWIVYAFALLFWGVLRQRSAARFASLAILIISIAKVFLLDMAALEGVARAGSFIGLGLSLIGVALFYQRYVFSAPGKNDPPPSSPQEGGSLPAQSPV